MAGTSIRPTKIMYIINSDVVRGHGVIHPEIVQHKHLYFWHTIFVIYGS